MTERQKLFSVKRRLKSFTFAFAGLRALFFNEDNAWIHLGAAIASIVLGFYFQISAYEWMVVVFAIGFVFSMEIVNTAIERLADFATQEIDDRIKTIKDLSAAAVLVSAITALAIGLLVFLPKLISH
ncbi:MAG: diacylglycerol kinase family protein [Cyclobacteriaceae bacterium]